jgi:hypothetical protein
MGSSNEIRIAIEQCSCKLCNTHLGAKLHSKTRSLYFIVSHCHKKLSIAAGLVRRWNNGTVVFFEEFVCGLYKTLPSYVWL